MGHLYHVLRVGFGEGGREGQGGFWQRMVFNQGREEGSTWKKRVDGGGGRMRVV